MALFFDQDWFDARLSQTGSTRADVARLLSLSEEQVAEIWKDQRELKAQDVLKLARFLNISPAEVANRAGVSTPVPQAALDGVGEVEALRQQVRSLEELVRDLRARIDRLERSDRG